MSALVSIIILVIAFIAVVVMDSIFGDKYDEEDIHYAAAMHLGISPEVLGNNTHHWAGGEQITAAMMNEHIHSSFYAPVITKPIKCAYCGRPLTDCGCGARIAE